MSCGWNNWNVLNERTIFQSDMPDMFKYRLAPDGGPTTSSSCNFSLTMVLLASSDTEQKELKYKCCTH